MGLVPLQANELELFNITYLPHYYPEQNAPFHKKWYSGLEDRALRYVLFEAMRGSGKTTHVSIGYPLKQICMSTDPEMHIFSRSGGSTGTASKIMDKIRNEIEDNALMCHDFGLKKGKHWVSDHIQVVRGDGSTFDLYSRGKGAGARGARGEVLIDDPQNAADCRSETVLAGDEEWFFTDILPIILKNNRLIFIGTPISPLSLCSTVKQLTDFHVLSFPAEDPPHSGISVWPEQYPDAFLAERLRIMGYDLYSAEYLCEPQVSGNPVFRPEWFQDFDMTSVQYQRIAKDFTYVVAAMDCAESKKDQADDTTMVVISATEGDKPDFYISHARSNKWSCKQGAEQLFLVFDEFQQHKSIVESRVKPPDKDAMIEEIEERQNTYKTYVNLYPYRPIKDKVTRAMRVQSICQEGRVFIDRTDPQSAKLLRQLTMFTGDQTFHDDYVDAFTMSLREHKQRDTRANENKGPNVQLPAGGTFAHHNAQRGYGLGDG